MSTVTAMRTLSPVQPRQVIRFCARCGSRPTADSQSRVCVKCHFGFVLEAAEDVAPRDTDPFLVVDRDLTICGLSKTAERLLGAAESTALQSAAPLYFVLDHGKAGSFARRLDDAVCGALERNATSFLSVRPVVAGPDGEAALGMRIGACGSPSGVVLVLVPAVA